MPLSLPRVSTLNNSTNLPRENPQESNLWLQLSTPSTCQKRRWCATDESPPKRVKLSLKDEYAASSECEERFMETSRMRFRTRVYSPLNQDINLFRGFTVYTLPILESFVSSCQSDLFRCDALEHQFLTPPYACSYSNAAKRGSTPFLAVSTEEGSVHIFNTVKRKEWDTEPSRTTLQPHNNGVFDVKWSPSDSLLATCSGDKSVRISCPNTSRLLHTFEGHTSSVKRVSWHPLNDSLLSTGGRDGTICVWDLRVPQCTTSSSQGPVFIIPDAHEPLNSKARRAKHQTPKTVTNLVFTEDMSLISSGSSDGVLRCWDFRFLSESGIRKPAKSKRFIPSLYSDTDPTTLYGSRRTRGILSLAVGTGPSSGLLFALGADSRIHTYSASSLTPYPINFTHPNLRVNGSFYLSSAVSPCGRWLASGGGESAILFDVAAAAKPYATALPGVELKAQLGEVYAVDWADGMLASGADDRTVRVWRPDVDVYRDCLADPEASKWKWCWASRSAK
ncbi:WD40-repeat-containing domain protein [Rhodocollybia butyracea]|uniref:WD40-repeat-containing domain protein n=1 Tax=Rhodocollybia butyracea TaxID=206335 RepID=A0A9P5Q1L5_9AGAR|nr:WD40-repeat-containing domain protein [Rhodocollybia butyracea]